eukprot:3471707-Alexandrium_andersonii.AAC.1
MPPTPAGPAYAQEDHPRPWILDDEPPPPPPPPPPPRATLTPSRRKATHFDSPGSEPQLIGHPVDEGGVPPGRPRPKKG